MWKKIAVIWKIPELRTKIGLTLLMLAIYRVGFQIAVPVLDSAKVKALSSQKGGVGDMLEAVAMLSASRLRDVTIFGLGIMPYISASIIFQLLGSVYPPLEQLQKECEAGRKKINEYTRYATFFLCVVQSWFYLASYVEGQGLVAEAFQNGDPNHLIWYWKITTVLTMTAGTIFLMWLGEQIDEFGIGNGISLLIMAGILARMPYAGYQLLQQASLELSGGGTKPLGIQDLIVLAATFVAVVTGVVFITLGQRRITMQSAKHVRGRRVFGGTKNYMPLKVDQAGVMPIIFASSLLMFPMIIFTNLANPNISNPEGWFGRSMQFLAGIFGRDHGYLYNLMYLILIYFFCYFWTAITFNPKDMADNLKNFGSFIPGYRPGKRTADYLEKVMVRITYVGAGFLALVAIIPTIISNSLGVDYNIASFYGGTGLLIAVSVAFDLIQKIDSHLVMRNYTGLLEA
jgi:preprotein translocase subunit SecY